MRRISPVTLAIVGAFIALVAANLVLSHDIPSGWGLKGIGIITLPFFAVGLLVARRRPGNSIGWILLVFAFAVLLSIDAANYAVLVVHVHRALPLGRLAVFLAPAWVPVLVPAPLPVVLFPDGKIPSGRWRWTFWAYIALALVFLADFAEKSIGAFTESPVPVIDKPGSLSALTAPVHGVEAVFDKATLVLYAACFASMVAYQIVRFRRSTGDERQQLKWFLASGALAVVGLIVATQSDTLGFMFVFIVALPIGIGLGILKYRLYDLDRLISRTVSYALLTGLLVGVFVGLVLVTSLLSFSSPVGVAAATLAAAALFTPLRSRLQRLVDRRFNRARYDAEAVVAAFGARLRDAVDVDTVLAELSSVATRSLEPATIGVWVRNDPGTAPL